jgi:parallel beta-helix repeat protein
MTIRPWRRLRPLGYLVAVLILGGVAAAPLGLVSLVRDLVGLDGEAAALVIEGERDVVIDGRTISSSGHCVVVRNSQNVTIRNSTIGPCHGRGISVQDSSGVTIAGNTIQPEFKPATCCDSGSGVYALRTQALTIDANTIAYSETNVELQSVTGARVTNNVLINPLGPFPRGQQVQVTVQSPSPPSRDVVIEGNRMIAGTGTSYRFPENQEDAVNLYVTENVTVRDNYIEGGHSKSGCGILADYASNGSRIVANRVFNSGNCGIGVASGHNQLVDGNQVLLTREIAGGGNVAIYVWRQSGTCGAVTVSNNVATFRRADGSHNPYWNGGGCTVTLEGNVFGPLAETVLDTLQVAPR